MSLELQSQDPIKSIADLARESRSTVAFLKLPDGALPDQSLVDEPHVMVITDGNGRVSVNSLKQHLDEIRAKPVFREGTATATTLDSFIHLVNRHANQDTAIFVDANWQAPKFTAVIDYHKRANDRHNPSADKMEAKAGEDPLARYGKHRITYAFPLSEPWRIWVERNGKVMNQVDFAAFLEDHIHEIAAHNPQDPCEMQWTEMFRTRYASPAELVDLARGLEVMVGVRVKSKVKLQSGETQMVFETEHKDAHGNEITVPGLFLVSVPVFYRGEPLRIPTRLRYRAGGEIMWSYELFRPDEFVDEHVRKAVEQVNSITGLPVYDGAPETR